MSAAVTSERHADVERFLEAAQSWLLESEVENNLLLGIALNRRAAEPDQAPPYWITLCDGNGIVGCACRTPPNPLVLSRAPLPAIAKLADDLSAADPALCGVTGPLAEAEAFAARWIARRGGQWKTRVCLRLHELRQLVLTAGMAAGALRKATQSDHSLACEWIAAYVRDAGTRPSTGDVAQRMIDRGQLYLWVVGDDDARSMVATTRDTGSGCSINTVYTPLRFRRSGYATAAVAALSGRLLDAGRRFCCLYTDVANPTSNSVYAKIGYRPVRDEMEIAFER